MRQNLISYFKLKFFAVLISFVFVLLARTLQLSSDLAMELLHVYNKIFCSNAPNLTLFQVFISNMMQSVFVRRPVNAFKKFLILTLVHFGQILMAGSMQLPLYIVGRTKNNRPRQTSFHMTYLFRRHRFCRYCDILNMERPTS